MRVWEVLVQTRSQTSLTLAKERRIRFFQELEERGEAIILRALDALSNHIHWILVTGGESILKSGTGNRRDVSSIFFFSVSTYTISIELVAFYKIVHLNC